MAVSPTIKSSLMIAQHRAKGSNEIRFYSKITEADSDVWKLMRHLTCFAILISLLGLVFILAGLRLSGTADQVWVLVGWVLAMSSFTFVGHTVDHSARWLLSLALFAHAYVAAFWFGGLLPLWLISLNESSALTALVIRRYSMLATKLVPVLFLAGMLLAVGLLQRFDDLTSPYGLLLLTKLGGFLLLLALASINKWRLVPAIDRSDQRATVILRTTLIAEYILIILIFIVTAALTTFTSPPADFDIDEDNDDGDPDVS